MAFVFLLAMFFYIFSGYILMRQGHLDIGAQPASPGLNLVFVFTGGPVASIGTLTLIVWSFCCLSWWMPIVGLFGASFAAGIAYGILKMSVFSVLNPLITVTSCFAGIVTTAVLFVS